MKQLILFLILMAFFQVNAQSYRDLSLAELQAAADEDDEIAIGLMAENYEFGIGVEKDITKAFQLYKRSAELNNASSQYNLAVMLINSKGVSEDLEQGFFWAEKSAEQSHAGAQFLLATLYEQGKGVGQDKKQAYEWYNRSALQRNPNAQYNVALMLLKGDGVTQDKKRGMEFLTQAADQNFAQAKSVLKLINNQK